MLQKLVDVIDYVKQNKVVDAEIDASMSRVEHAKHALATTGLFVTDDIKVPTFTAPLMHLESRSTCDRLP